MYLFMLFLQIFLMYLYILAQVHKAFLCCSFIFFLSHPPTPDWGGIQSGVDGRTGFEIEPLSQNGSSGEPDRPRKKRRQTWLTSCWKLRTWREGGSDMSDAVSCLVFKYFLTFLDFDLSGFSQVWVFLFKNLNFQKTPLFNIHWLKVGSVWGPFLYWNFPLQDSWKLCFL